MMTVTKQFDAVNPATAEPFLQIPDLSIEDVRATIANARMAFDNGPWKDFTYAERGIYLKVIARIIRDHAKELADLEVADIGKTSKHANFIDIPTCADCFDYYSQVCLSDKDNNVDAPVKSRTIHEPRGVVASIFTYNYPMIYAAWKIAPAIITGNVVILKPSPLGSASIHRLSQLIGAADLPEGVINFVTTTNNDSVMELVRNDDVDMVSFTGGTRTGQIIMAEAAKTTKKVILELGGKSPNIVFDDCNMDAAVGGAMAAIFINQGQMCTAGSRLFLHEKIYDEFLEKLIARTASLRIGDPRDAVTEFGPLASEDQRDVLLKIIQRAKADGAHVTCGGNVPQTNGYYLEPTIVTNVTNDMEIAQEECFGPVLSVMKFSSEEEVIVRANDSKYGLAASVWTKDENKAERIAKALQAGTVWINTYGNFYNQAPFGGYKQSGFGRELGDEGLLEYTQAKHICTDQTPGGMPLTSAWF